MYVFIMYAPFLKSKMTTFNLLVDPKVVGNQLEKCDKFFYKRKYDRINDCLHQS